MWCLGRFYRSYDPVKFKELDRDGGHYKKMSTGGGVAGGRKKPINERRCIKERRF